jgi:NAD(P)-dependent dehydrogenase (short-subunit alcohol dehydrogenase family)
MKDTTSFPLKKVLISGAAGGLGSVLVNKFAALGYYVIAIDIDRQGLTRFDGLPNVVTKIIDITDTGQLKIMAKEIDLDVHGLDILICLAGIYDTYPVTEEDPSLLKKIIDVNLLGVVSMVKYFLEPLIIKHGRVIVVSSESYKMQALFQPYMISKAVLEAYCRVARQELALKGVKLTVIRPGAIRTPLLNWMSSPGNPGQYPVFDREFRASWNRSIKMVGKITSPEKVADKIVTASTVSKPGRVIRINNNPFLTLVSLLPSGLTEKLIIGMFRLKDK